MGGSWGWDVAAAHRIGGAAWQHQGDLLPHDSKPACVHVHAMSCAWHAHLHVHACACACGVRAVCVRCACGVRAVCVRCAYLRTPSVMFSSSSLVHMSPRLAASHTCTHTCI